MNTKRWPEAPKEERVSSRQKILTAAYDLFAAQGAKSVGVDTVSARCGAAKMTLYRHFSSKEALVVAFLDLREERWSEDWLKAGVSARSKHPRDRLLIIFDLYHEWFQAPAFDGCPFIKILCETAAGSVVHAATARKLDNILNFIVHLAREAKLPDPTGLARAWMMLMEGSTLDAYAGHRDAALKAKRAATVLLEAWAQAGKPKPRSAKPRSSIKRKR